MTTAASMWASPRCSRLTQSAPTSMTGVIQVGRSFPGIVPRYICSCRAAAGWWLFPTISSRSAMATTRLHASGARNRPSAPMQSHAMATRSDMVLIAGDFNDTPTSQPITHIFEGGFADVKDHPDYPTHRPGTFGTGLAGIQDRLPGDVPCPPAAACDHRHRAARFIPSQQIWEPFDTVTGTSTEASDHHLVLVEVRDLKSSPNLAYL